jgi:hypothetical protein
MISSSGPILLADYVTGVADTDLLSSTDLRPALMGLYGEVGSIMATSKKSLRENGAFVGFEAAAEEEFGDALWYLNAIAVRTAIPLPDLFTAAMGSDVYKVAVATSGVAGGAVAHVYSSVVEPDINAALIELGVAATSLFVLQQDRSKARELLTRFAHSYVVALHAAKVDFSKAVHRNLAKARGRFLPHDKNALPNFDSGFILDEQIPQKFEITITERKSGRSYLQWHGVYIGDPLTDNIADSDGYRFHDVFHLAHAAILHWSPVFRALIKHKRKSARLTDEAQDGGRAIVVEEGLTAWLFARAKDINFFEGQQKVSFDLLKTVQQFVQGYEVHDCPLSLWEQAILRGYAVFREVKRNNGGIIVCDRNARTISYRANPQQDEQ